MVSPFKSKETDRPCWLLRSLLLYAIPPPFVRTPPEKPPPWQPLPQPPPKKLVIVRFSRFEQNPTLFYAPLALQTLFSRSQQNKADEKEPGPDCLKHAQEIFYPTQVNVDLKQGNSCGPVCKERGKCVETTLQDGDSQKEILPCRTTPAAASRSAFLGGFLMGLARGLCKLMNGAGIKKSSGPQPRPPPPTWEGYPPALIFPAPSQERPQPPKTRRPALTSLDPDPSIRPPREEDEPRPPRPTFKDRRTMPHPLIIIEPHDP